MSALAEKDRTILAELQRDSRLTMQQLAQKVGMSSSACWRRVRALEEEGVIDRYTVILNPGKAGFPLSFMTLVSLARHEERNVDKFMAEVMVSWKVEDVLLRNQCKVFSYFFPERIPPYLGYSP